LFGVTEGEAANLAILLWQSWKVINAWRYQEHVFNNEVLGKPGSQMEILDDAEKTTKPISHKDFIKLYNKWHSSLGAALIGCLKSTEYMHMRAGLVVLTRLVDVFPTRPGVGNKLLEALEPLQDENSSRPDIRASANAYGMMVVKARDEGKWVEEDEAVAKARADKEKAAAEERKKKLEQTFQEIERDSEKITAEIGPRDRHDRRRDYATTRGPDDLDNGRQAVGRSADQINARSSDFARMESGELLGRDRSRDDRDRRPGRDTDRRDRDAPNEDRGRGRAVDDDWRRDGGAARDDRRWQRDITTSRGAKRSRPSTPDNDHELERSSTKRSRLDAENYSSRRNAGSRGEPSPPPRRPRRDSPEQPSRPRTRRNRR